MISKAETDQLAFYKEFIMRHESIYLGSGIGTRSRFTELRDQDEITNFDGLIRYVAANPYSRAAKLFVTMKAEIPQGNVFAEFVRRHLESCQSSCSFYLGSFFKNPSKILDQIGKGEITRYRDVEDYAEDNPGSRTTRVMKSRS